MLPLPAGSPPYLGSKEIRDAMGFPNTPQPVLDEFLRSGIKHQYPFTFGFFGHPAPGETLKGKLPWTMPPTPWSSRAPASTRSWPRSRDVT